MRVLVSLLGVLGLACSQAEGQPAAPATRGEGPLVLELFTSQGCSSCPPADRLLGELAKDARLVPLSFHVDYWNGLGWADPYSSPAWTQRQHDYAKALREPRVYTPELVVGGAEGVVGSQAARVKAAVARARRPAALPVRATWADAAALEVTATAPPDADVYVAVWEAQRITAVPRGENAGETLANAHVVRRLERIATAGRQGAIRVAVDPAWRGVGAVAFAQGADRRIVATARIAGR